VKEFPPTNTAKIAKWRNSEHLEAFLPIVIRFSVTLVEDYILE